MDRTILAIDDESDMLAFYRIALADLGVVKTASSLSEAMKQLEGVDLIVLDFHLEHDPDLIQEIVPKLRKVAPVLLCSGIQEAGVPAIGVALGIAGYWHKGSDHESLRSLVRSVLDTNSPAL